MWKPIEIDEFLELYNPQVDSLDAPLKEIFSRFQVPVGRAVIRRSEKMGDEFVFYVAEKDGHILYFDDVEYGFNYSRADGNKRITCRGGSQMDLADAIMTWLA